MILSPTVAPGSHGWRSQVAHGQLDHDGEQLVLPLDMAVERHFGEVEFGGHPLMEIPASPSASAMSIAAWAMRSTLSTGLGPRLGGRRSPHSNSPVRSKSRLQNVGLVAVRKLCLIYTASSGHCFTEDATNETEPAMTEDTGSQRTVIADAVVSIDGYSSTGPDDDMSWAMEHS
ncbi:hypothetical protein [Actinomadura rudentiformis]|uniref:hypothetical protein n=1 Tax=Actinomadura rudentiformis TaxID=359158 RepID=UPI001CEF6EC1|nr:hypothetical protein [Actinomadura rudentiformis]